MKRLLAAIALLTVPAAAQQRADRAPAAPAATEGRVERALRDAGFAGIFAVSEAGTRTAGGAIGEAAPGQPFLYEMLFPWASVTKQAVATMVMQDVAAGRVTLDAPASRYFRELRARPRSPTLRQLLQHRSGLRNPDDTPRDAGGWPTFYTGGPTGIEWCLGARRAPGGAWRYNNCDYLILGGILERVNRRPLADLFAERIAGPVGARVRFVGTPVGLDADTLWRGGPDIPYLQALDRFGSAGGLIGTADDMLAFDRGLMSGALLTERARAEMWRGDPKLGYQALGQWSFAAPIAGCAAPVRLVERRGAIGSFQVRNFIAPEQGVAMVLLTNRGEGSFDFGEIWQGKGVSHDTLAAVLCR